MKRQTTITIQVALASWLLTAASMTAQAQKHFGEYMKVPQYGCQITEELYQEQFAPKLQESYDKLIKEGKLIIDSRSATLTPGSLHWPVRMAPFYENLSGVGEAFTQINYTDRDPYLALKDWMCFTGELARTYNNHSGADIGVQPWSWKAQSEGVLDVVAAADGQVLWVHDGAFDLNCTGPVGTYDATGTDFDRPWWGNYVALVHDGGMVTLYAHMKNGSVASLEVGDFVGRGQFLGKVGSSGNSLGPHLHFEVRTSPSSNSWVEPWFAPNGCNTTVEASLWADQHPYHNPKILRVATLSSLPESVSCDDVENDNAIESVAEVNHFTFLQPMYFTVYLRDRPALSNLTLRIYSPSNSLIQTYTNSGQNDYLPIYGPSSWWVGHTLGFTSGTYRAEAQIGDEILSHYFTLGCTSSHSLSGLVIGRRGWIAGSHINTTQVIAGGIAANQIRYEAGNYIQFNPGFVAAEGSTLHTRIDACVIGGKSQQNDEEPVHEELAEFSQFEVYPNPTRDEFTVAASLENQVSNARIVIRNSLGQELTSRSSSNTSHLLEQFSGLNLAAGLYFVEIHSGTTRQVKKLVIQ